MNIVSDMYQHEKPVDIIFQEVSQTFTDATLGPEVWSNLLTTTGLFFIGSKVDTIVGERLRASVDGVILIDYANITKDVTEQARVKINDGYYTIVYMDNVCFQDELYVIPVKRV